jgi:hypothetical protein
MARILNCMCCTADILREWSVQKLLAMSDTHTCLPSSATQNVPGRQYNKMNINSSCDQCKLVLDIPRMTSNNKQRSCVFSLSVSVNFKLVKRHFNKQEYK